MCGNLNASENVYAGLGFSGSFLELYNNAAYIDFHYFSSPLAYTARIMELSSGRLTVYNSISNASDRRLKKDISDLPDKYLDVLKCIKPQTYRYIKGDEYLNIGFIAQDVEESFRNNGFEDIPIVSREEVNGGKYSLDYGGITALNTMGLQYILKKFEGRCRQIDHLESKIRKLEKQLEEINE